MPNVVPSMRSMLLLQASGPKRRREISNASAQSKRLRHGSHSRSGAGQTGTALQPLGQLADGAEQVQAAQQPSVSDFEQPVPPAGLAEVRDAAAAPGAPAQPATAAPATAVPEQHRSFPASSADSPSPCLKGTAVGEALQAAALADERSQSLALPEGSAAALQPGASAGEPRCESLLGARLAASANAWHSCCLLAASV